MYKNNFKKRMECYVSPEGPVNSVQWGSGKQGLNHHQVYAVISLPTQREFRSTWPRCQPTCHGLNCSQKGNRQVELLQAMLKCSTQVESLSCPGDNNAMELQEGDGDDEGKCGEKTCIQLHQGLCMGQVLTKTEALCRCPSLPRFITGGSVD